MSLAGEAHELYAFDDTASNSSNAEQRRSSLPSEKTRVVFPLMFPLVEGDGTRRPRRGTIVLFD
jgi:hypothetical protein